MHSVHGGQSFRKVKTLKIHRKSQPKTALLGKQAQFGRRISDLETAHSGELLLGALQARKACELDDHFLRQGHSPEAMLGID